MKNPPPGIGIDVVDINQFRTALRRGGFRDKIFTPAEIETCESRRDPLPSYAARFAVKEAFYKALADPGLTAVPWKQIETTVEDNVPTIHLSDTLQKRMSGRRVFISLTHSSQVAAAVVLLIPAGESLLHDDNNSRKLQ